MLADDNEALDVSVEISIKTKKPDDEPIGWPMDDIGHKPAYWRKGQRVCRNGTDILGTIVAANGQIKVKWDGGRTSYFHRDRFAKLHSADNQGLKFK